MILAAFVEFVYLRACSSSSAKKKVEIGSGVNLTKGMKFRMCVNIC